MLATEEHSPARTEELRDFLLVLRRALLLVTCWIEQRYGLKARECSDCPLRR